MKSDLEQTLETKDCPICTQALPLSEFGICRARKDGRNHYCKSCIRKKVTESRQVLREYKSARKRYVSQQSLEAQGSDSSPQNLSRLLSKLSPIERVREAIKNGSRTHKEIRAGAKLGDDEVGDALANLLLWTHEIRTEVVDNTRMYFINEAVETSTLRHEEVPKFPRRKPDVPSSFSALQGLMPGRKPEGETEKIGGWVAA
jgi:hypothetical protein